VLDSTILPWTPRGSPAKWRVLAAALILALMVGATGFKVTSAKAPAHATAVFDVGVYPAPDLTSATMGTLSAGTEVELTGEAAPGFLAIYYADGVGWVPAQYLSLGVRPGIDTAVTIVDTPLLEAPIRDADVVVIVPEGESVILTGAAVGGYDAASHDGAGGWLDHRDIAR
jgi:hypothetical protein